MSRLVHYMSNTIAFMARVQSVPESYLIDHLILTIEQIRSKRVQRIRCGLQGDRADVAITHSGSSLNQTTSTGLPGPELRQSSETRVHVL